MLRCRTTAKEHTRLFDLKYHIVWVTKYRKPILTTKRALRTRELIREIAQSKNVQILKGHVSKDHIHLFVSVPPSLSIANLVQLPQRQDLEETTPGRQGLFPKQTGVSTFGPEATLPLPRE
jgi:REP element-mobilizing transposase RayT